MGALGRVEGEGGARVSIVYSRCMFTRARTGTLHALMHRTALSDPSNKFRYSHSVVYFGHFKYIGLTRRHTSSE